MGAAVAGTPCIVHPFTDEQHGVARLIDGIDGFVAAYSPRSVLKAIADPPACPQFENGAETVASHVMADLRE